MRVASNNNNSNLVDLKLQKDQPPNPMSYLSPRALGPNPLQQNLLEPVLQSHRSNPPGPTGLPPRSTSNKPPQSSSMTAVPRKKRLPPPVNVLLPFTNSINSDLLEGNFTNLHAPPDGHMWKL